MLVKNLRLNFDRQNDDKLILKTEHGTEVILPDYLLEQYSDHQQPVYLSIDTKPLTANEDNQKEILNELIDKQD